jgi:prephenate dehydratase
MKIYYLGPSKTYSEEAAQISAKKIGNGCIIEAKETLEEVLKNTSEQDLGVIAYYNRTIGLMQDHLDLIKKYGLTAIDRIIVPIILTIGNYPGGKNSDCVYSHEKALAQCTEYLQRYPNIKLISVNSTAEGANIVSKKKNGFAIAKKEALIDAGLEILAEDVGNMDGKIPNFTDFMVVKKDKALINQF